MNKPMDLQFSVFNGHKNDADKRARALMRAICPSLAKEIEAVSETGIMAIFQSEPTPAAYVYAAMVAAYVNEIR